MSAALRRNASSLWYGLLCLAGAFGMSCLSQDFPIFRVFPELEWAAYVRLCYLIIYTVPLWLFLTARSLFGGVSPRSAALLSLPAAILAILVLALPPWHGPPATSRPARAARLWASLPEKSRSPS